jgi:GNAT superfamily N-acetyltransferase
MTREAGTRTAEAHPSRGLAPGTVTVRDASTADLDALRGMFSRSSAETIQGRFHLPYPRVPEWMLAQLLGGGPSGGRALVAVDGDEVVGHAMRGPLRDGEAEVAVVVEDAWQHRGVGRRLLAGLAQRSRGEGVEAFVATALGENRRALKLGGSVFGAGEARIEDGCYVMRAPLWSLRGRGAA